MKKIPVFKRDFITKDGKKCTAIWFGRFYSVLLLAALSVSFAGCTTIKVKCNNGNSMTLKGVSFNTTAIVMQEYCK